MTQKKDLNFKQVKEAALVSIDLVLNHWLSGGKRSGKEYVVKNPTRNDNKSGSFSVNLHTGVWSDFSCSDSGGDLISLIAYLEGIAQGEACKRLAGFLGIDTTKNDQNKNTKKASKKRPVNEWKPITPSLMTHPRRWIVIIGMVSIQARGLT